MHCIGSDDVAKLKEFLGDSVQPTRLEQCGGLSMMRVFDVFSLL